MTASPTTAPTRALDERLVDHRSEVRARIADTLFGAWRLEGVPYAAARTVADLCAAAYVDRALVHESEHDRWLAVFDALAGLGAPLPRKGGGVLVDRIVAELGSVELDRERGDEREDAGHARPSVRPVRGEVESCRTV